jgi:hypothetical protein
MNETRNKIREQIRKIIEAPLAVGKERHYSQKIYTRVSKTL